MLSVSYKFERQARVKTTIQYERLRNSCLVRMPVFVQCLSSTKFKFSDKIIIKPVLQKILTFIASNIMHYPHNKQTMSK